MHNTYWCRKWSQNQSHTIQKFSQKVKRFFVISGNKKFNNFYFEIIFFTKLSTHNFVYYHQTSSDPALHAYLTHELRTRLYFPTMITSPLPWTFHWHWHQYHRSRTDGGTITRQGNWRTEAELVARQHHNSGSEGDRKQRESLSTDAQEQSAKRERETTIICILKTINHSKRTNTRPSNIKRTTL